MKSRIIQLTAHVLVFSAMNASAAIRYVKVNSTNPAPPYQLDNCGRNHPGRIDAAVVGDQILVTNGVYNQSNSEKQFSEVPQ